MLQIATHSFFAESRGRRGRRRLLSSCLTRKTTTQRTNQAPNPINYGFRASMAQKRNLSKLGFKPTTFRVLGSCSLLEPLFQILDFAPRCSCLFAHPPGVTCWFSWQIIKSSPKLSKLWVWGHIHTKTNSSKLGLKPTIFRVWGSITLNQCHHKSNP